MNNNQYTSLPHSSNGGGVNVGANRQGPRQNKKKNYNKKKNFNNNQNSNNQSNNNQNNGNVKQQPFNNYTNNQG